MKKISKRRDELVSLIGEVGEPISVKAAEIEARPQDYDADDIIANRDKYVSATRLTVFHMRFIEFFSLGLTILKAADMAGIRGDGTQWTDDANVRARCVKILSSKKGVLYLKKLNQEYRKGHYITRERVIRDLAARLPGAKNADAVKIAGILAKMEGWNVEVDDRPQINISWGTDPFVEARKEKQVSGGSSVLIGEGEEDA